MDAHRRQQALSVFGVVQYRERGHASESVLDVVTETTNFGDEEALVARPDINSDAVSSSIEALRAVTQDLVDPNHANVETDSSFKASSVETASPIDTHNQAADSRPSAAESENKIGARKFDLLFWRCGNLLAVESSRDSDQRSRDQVTKNQVTKNQVTKNQVTKNQVNKDQTTTLGSHTKHRLVNNIFRAVYGQQASGATMYDLHWPDQLNKTKASEEKVSDAVAAEWLYLFFKGQLAKDSETKLWLMGEDIVELMLSKHGAREELEGTRLSDNKLGMEVFVSPSLSDLAAKPYLKASVWKLLRVLAPGADS